MLFPPVIPPCFDLLGLVGVNSSGFLDLFIFIFGRGYGGRSLLLFRSFLKEFLLLFGFGLFFGNYRGRIKGQRMSSRPLEVVAT